MKKITLLLSFFLLFFLNSNLSFSQVTYTFSSIGGSGNNPNHNILNTNPSSVNLEIQNNMTIAGGDVYPNASGSGSHTFTIKGNAGTTGSFDVVDMTWATFSASSTLEGANTKIVFTKTNGTTVTWNTLKAPFTSNTSFKSSGHSVLAIFNSSSTVTNVTQIEITADFKGTESIENFEVVNITLSNITAAVSNTAPVIAGTSSGQTVSDTSTIAPFSSITTTDADGDNLTATITLDNNAKGILTGASSGSGPYTITSRSPAAMQTALRALTFNPTDNRSATSETTTFTVVINDGTDTDSDNGTTVISSAVAPTITSINATTINGTYKSGDNVVITATFSENVNVTGTPQITLETGTTDRTINYNGTGSGTNTLQFTYIVQSGDSTADLDYVATNSLTAGTSIQDAGGANATLVLPSPGAANSLGANKAIVIDGIVPTVTSVSATTADGSYKTGDNVVVTVTFSENVTVTGTPQITLETGTTDRTIDYNGTGSGTNTLQFNYTVQAGDTTADLDYVTVNSLTAGTSIQDAAGNNATLTLPSPGAANSLSANKAIVIDGIVPTLVSSNPTDNATNVAISSNIELTFSENISKGMGNIIIKKTSDDSTVENIDVTTAAVTISSNTATINPTSDLDLNTEYYVQIDNTAFKDVADNNYSGISDTTSLSFTTEVNQTNTYSGSGNWSASGNWSLVRLPIASDNVQINFGSTVIFDVANATVNDITISSGTLNMIAGNALTIDGNLTQNGTFNIDSNATANASLIVKGTATGNVNFLRYLTTNWHLISSPVVGKSINDLSGSVSTNGVNYAIAPYKNNTTRLLRWNYYTTAAGTNDIAAASTFVTAKGYTIKKNGFAGSIGFAGTLNTNDAGESITITDGGNDPGGNRWNLIGSPYTAALKGGNSTPANQTNTFLRVNIDAGNLDPMKAGVYLWNGSLPYDIKSVDDDFFIAPGQAFFVHAPDNGGTSANFTEAMQTHQTGNIFLKNAKSYPEIILRLSNDKSNVLTKIRYIEGKTTGLDIGSDVGTFTAESSNFNIFSHLLSNSEGADFAIQALPNNNYENMIIPIGIDAETENEITFSTTMNNFPEGLKVYLEDKKNNTFTRIDETNSDYKITLDKAQNGIGRFYLHTTSKALSIDKNETLKNISVYKLNNSTLRIAGLTKEKTELSVYNLLGKQVFNSSFTTNGIKDIALPNFTKGVYLVQLKTISGKISKKIVLE